MVWNMARKGFMERPIFGWGQESFNYVFSKHYDPKMYLREQWFDRTHSVFLDWLIAGGLLALLSYLSLFAGALWIIWRSKDAKGEHLFPLPERAIMTGLLGAYFVHNGLVFDNITSYLLFVSFFAYFHAKGSAGEKPMFGNVLADKGTVSRVVTPLVLVALIFAIYFANVRPIYAGSLLIKAGRPSETGPTKNLELFKKAIALNTFANSEIREQLTQGVTNIAKVDIPNDIKQQFFDLARSELEKQINHSPKDARYLLFMGSFLDAFRFYAEARPYLLRAIKLSPTKQQFLYELGSGYLNSGDFENGMLAFKRAYEILPENREARVIYAVGAIYAGKLPIVAEVIIPPIFPDGYTTDERVLQAYMNTKRFDKIVEIWRKEIENNPKNAEAHLRLAGGLLQGGDSFGAIKEIRKAVELDPSRKEEGENYIRAIQAEQR